MKFEPRLQPDGSWACPCKDGPVLERRLTADRAVDLNISNYRCKEGDRWQQLGKAWHYIGRSA